MTHYLLTIWQPDSEEPPPPEVVDLEQVMQDVEALKAEMREAGVWVFSGGLFPASRSTVVKVAEGRALMTDGPYIEGKEHVGGFTIVTAPDLDAALEWGRKLAAATTLPIEVRPFVGVME